MAETLDLRIDKGSRWVAEFIPVIDWLTSISGYSARGKVKTSRTLPNAEELFDFSPYMTVSGESVLIDVPATATIGLDWTSGAYDFELYDGTPAHAIRFLQGTVQLDEEVTT